MPDEREAYLFPYDSWASRVAVEAFVRDINRRKGRPASSFIPPGMLGYRGGQGRYHFDPKKAEEFGHRLDGLAKKHDEGDKGAGKQVDDLTKYLTKLVRSGELTSEGFRRIDAALAGV